MRSPFERGRTVGSMSSDHVGTAPALPPVAMPILHAIAAVVVAIAVDAVVVVGARIVVAALGVDVLGALSLLARGLI
jgi:hypothetical protein